MDCLLCYKVFLKEKEFENYNPNPQVWKKAIVKLFGLSIDAGVQGLSEDLLVCLGCHLKLEEVEGLVDQLEELQRRVDEAKIEIKNEMLQSKEISQAMAERTAANRMSPSSQGRLSLLKAIEAKTQPQGAPVAMDQAENGNEPIGRNAIDRGIQVQNEPPETRAQIGVGMEIIESVQGPSQPSDGSTHGESNDNNPERSDVPSGSKTKGGYGLRKHTPSQKVSYVDEDSSDTDGESSHDESGSESESGEGFSSEDDTRSESKTAISSNEPAAGTRGGDNARRAPGSIKEFTPLKNGSFKCKHCTKILRKMSLRNHLLIHRPRRFKCSIQGCGKRFTFKIARDNHVKNVHEGRKDFKCTWGGCGKWFGEKGTLISHVKVVHEGKKDHKCQIRGCNYASGSRRNLNRHMSAKHK